MTPAVGPMGKGFGSGATSGVSVGEAPDRDARGGASHGLAGVVSIAPLRCASCHGFIPRNEDHWAYDEPWHVSCHELYEAGMEAELRS